MVHGHPQGVGKLKESWACPCPGHSCQDCFPPANYKRRTGTPEERPGNEWFLARPSMGIPALRLEFPLKTQPDGGNL